MHRSGTSLVARVLNLLGLDLGPEEDLLEPRFDNPRGYWEQRPVMEVNDAILARLGGSWSHPPDMPSGWIRRPEVEALADRARQVVASQFGDSRRWAWKDPRTSLTLPFWREHLPGARWIVCLRSPPDVAASLLQRHALGHTWESALALWLLYTVKAMENTSSEDRLLVFYDDWFQDAEAELTRLASFAGCDLAQVAPSVRRDIDAFLDAALRHHRSTALEVADTVGLSLEGRAFYLALRGAHVLSRVVAARRAELAETMESTLAPAVERLALHLGRADPERDAVTAAQKERDAARQVERKLRGELGHKLKALAEVRERAERLEPAVRERDRALARVQASLAQERRARRALEASASWRLTRPLRASKGVVTRFKREENLPRWPQSPESGNGASRDARVAEDFVLTRRNRSTGERSQSKKARKVLVPCADWSVSGVNTSLEAVGRQLVELGWDVEVLFTRDEQFVQETAGSNAHMPKLPYRHLHREKPGIAGMWEALIGEVEQSAPCLFLMGYDFLANSVAPALTEGVGVITWVQADDSDYYEQVYRLGRYCNAVICVSQRIKDNVAMLNPVIGKRTEVIPNSSVWRRDVATHRPEPGSQMRIVYSGRLTQYQKRILDFVELAAALDEADVAYEVSLVGTFSPHEETGGTFEMLARPYLEDGRIKLLGRMPREELLEQLTEHDFFVLLSDFEGLPLSLIEAMARGCVPFVAESESGIPEIIEHDQNGFIVRGRDYDAWARLLVEVWWDRRRLSEVSERARETIRRRFAMEDVARQFDGLLQRVAEEIESGAYRRPPSLTWGEQQSGTGDVLPPPMLQRPGAIRPAGLGERQPA